MAIKKTVLKRDTGVCLTLVEETIGNRPGPKHYRLTTLRPAQPRVIADKAMAQAAFNAEVAASKLDPIAVQISSSMM